VSENIVVFVKVGDQKLVIGTLSADKHPQVSCDLIFDEAFELSHNSKTTSVFLCGYKSVMPDTCDSDEDEGKVLRSIAAAVLILFIGTIETKYFFFISDEEMEAEVPVKKNETGKLS
jgi:hypothetical protein